MHGFNANTFTPIVSPMSARLQDSKAISSSNFSHVTQQLIHSLRKHFGLKYLGKQHYFLGIKVSWTTNGHLHLSQTMYIIDLLHKANMHTVKPQPTPMVLSVALTHDGSTIIEDQALYHSFVGSHQYLLITRLNRL